MKKISIIVPIYNEEKTLEELIKRILKANVLGLEMEIVVVDDCSVDMSFDIVSKLQKKYPILQYYQHQKNSGKGAALRTGFSKATGDIVLIQDADLEYDPSDYPKLLSPICSGKADVVYGSRFRSSEAVRVMYFWHRVANALLTVFSNMFTNLNLTDMETGYKVFKKEILDSLSLKENRFGIEPEMTAKIAKISGIRIYEVGISYSGRTYEEGKKIGLKDAFRALYVIIKSV
jgi:glycosyltransferase involved in cell wall biosynthesis